MSGPVSYRIEERIAYVTLDVPEKKVNVLDAEMLSALEETAGRLADESGLRGAVVASAKDRGFIAGADIGVIEAVDDPARGTRLAAEGQRILGLWAALPFPVVAAIHGHCMGGGTEFALACGYRVATEAAGIALPEVKLGLFPGFGGTQRLPRLIGLEKALGIILKGRGVGGEEAFRCGLVDRLGGADRLVETAAALAREVYGSADHILAERRRKRGGLRALLLERNPLGRWLLFRMARKNLLAKTGGHYPAPLRALEVVRFGWSRSLEAGLTREAEELGRIVVTPECKNLIHVYHLNERPKKGAGVAAGPRPLERAAVLGAGVMGGGIAQLLAARDIPVHMKDIEQQAVDDGLEHARAVFAEQAKKKGWTRGDIDRKMERLAGTTNYDRFAEVDLVIEAVVEKMEVKQAVLKETEEHLKETAVFATNTSALSVSELQSVAEHPGRVGGMHFFNPVHRMPLVEVVRGARTDDATVATIHAAARRLGKTPVVVADRPGFLVNRLLVSYLLEAGHLAREGVDWVALDKRIKAFGLPMGPFRLIDEVGIDIGAEVGDTLCGALDYLKPTDLMIRAREEGLLGKKGGKGFYVYEGGHSKEPNPDVDALLNLSRERAPGDEDLDRLLYLMVNEAARCLEEEVVAEPADVDTGMIFGTGFPPFRGGLCRWADSVGLEPIVGRLEELAGRHGRRFAPAPYLRKRKHGRFY